MFDINIIFFYFIFLQISDKSYEINVVFSEKILYISHSHISTLRTPTNSKSFSIGVQFNFKNILLFEIVLYDSNIGLHFLLFS